MGVGAFQQRPGNNVISTFFFLIHASLSFPVWCHTSNKEVESIHLPLRSGKVVVIVYTHKKSEERKRISLFSFSFRILLVSFFLPNVHSQG